MRSIALDRKAYHLALYFLLVSWFFMKYLRIAKIGWLL